MNDARAKKFDCLLVWMLDRFGRSLVDCFNRIRNLEIDGVRCIATTQGLDTDQQNSVSRPLGRQNRIAQQNQKDANRRVAMLRHG
jgi:DNA invertase Pin-like site-specific DNA recombinase